MADQRRYRQIYSVLKKQISDGALASGARLNIGALVDEHDVSRDTVQRALQLLEADGLVERWPGLGWFVA